MGPRRAVPGPGVHPRRPVRGDARRRARRSRRDGRRARRRDHRGGDARGADGRRSVRAVGGDRRLRPGRVAADATCLRDGSGGMGRQRRTLPPAPRRPVPLGRPECAHEQRVRGRLRRGEVARGPEQHDTDCRSDRCRDLLAGPRCGSLEPDHPHAHDQPGSRPRGGRAALRDDQPGRCRRADQLLERQVLLGLLAADHCHSRGSQRWQSHDRPGSRLESPLRHAAVPRPSVRSRLCQRRRREHPPGLLRHGQDRVQCLQQQLADAGASIACRMPSRRS
jgi:hypothetical protein